MSQLAFLPIMGLDLRDPSMGNKSYGVLHWYKKFFCSYEVEKDFKTGGQSHSSPPCYRVVRIAVKVFGFLFYPKIKKPWRTMFTQLRAFRKFLTEDVALGLLCGRLWAS